MNQIAFVRPSLVTQGTTSSPSRIAIDAFDFGENLVPINFAVRVRLCVKNTVGTLLSSGGYFSRVAGSSAILQQHSGGTDWTITGITQSSATGVLTFTGTSAKDKYVQIGSRIYYLVDSQASATINTNVTNRIPIYLASYPASASTILAALVATMNADPYCPITATTNGTTTLTATSKRPGDVGNDIGLASTLSNATWGGTSLSSGYDATAGRLLLDINDANAEEFSVYLGRPTFRGQGACYKDHLNLAHAA